MKPQLSPKVMGDGAFTYISQDLFTYSELAKRNEEILREVQRLLESSKENIREYKAIREELHLEDLLQTFLFAGWVVGWVGWNQPIYTHPRQNRQREMSLLGWGGGSWWLSPIWRHWCHREISTCGFWHGRGLCWWKAMAGKPGEGLLRRY